MMGCSQSGWLGQFLWSCSRFRRAVHKELEADEVDISKIRFKLLGRPTLALAECLMAGVVDDSVYSARKTTGARDVSVTGGNRIPIITCTWSGDRLEASASPHEGVARRAMASGPLPASIVPSTFTVTCQVEVKVLPH